MLLHVCCATCALPIIKHLFKTRSKEDIILRFYNSNIYPEVEYKRRLKNVEKVVKIYKLKLIVGKYEHSKWLDYVKKSLPQPPEKYPENSKRCLNCFRFRLEEIVEFAKKNNFDEFATTLSVNRFKDTEFINKYGRFLANKYKIKYKEFDIDFNKAHKLGLKLSKKYNLYRQKYCGCEFSMI